MRSAASSFTARLDSWTNFGASEASQSESAASMPASAATATESAKVASPIASILPFSVARRTPTGVSARSASQAARASPASVCTSGAAEVVAVGCSSRAWSSAAPSILNTRSRSVLNWRRSNRSRTAGASIGCRARSAGPYSSSTSVRSALSRRLSTARSCWSRRFCPTTPVISSACASRFSTVPYCWIHLTAVFSPTLSMPIRLSLDSPTRAAISGYWAGSIP